MISLPDLSKTEIRDWIAKPAHDVRTWVLRPGAPRHVVDKFPAFIDLMLMADHQPGAVPQFDGAIPPNVDMSNPSTLLVRVYQLARDARRYSDEAIAIGLDKPLATRLETHAKDLELLRDQVHDALLSPEDRANGAQSRLEQS